MKAQDMTPRYRKFKRARGMWCAFDNVTGNSAILQARIKAEAEQKVNAMNETERVPSISLGLVKVYLNATDPKLAAISGGARMRGAKVCATFPSLPAPPVRRQNFDRIIRGPTGASAKQSHASASR
ncbi:MAG: hypothetical protein RLZZ188_1029 [Verrucomicrobiota bacterium]|jgi:hypothetical protein